MVVSQQQLLLLLVELPPTPSSLRVRVWRRLRSLGAVALKRSAYLLPDTPERYEDFQWLAQEIQRDGGDAMLIRVQQIENLSPGEVLRLFHEPRDRDYRQLAARYRKVLQKLDKKSKAGPRRPTRSWPAFPRTINGSVTSTSSTPPAAPRSGVSRRPSPCAPDVRSRYVPRRRRRSI